MAEETNKAEDRIPITVWIKLEKVDVCTKVQVDNAETADVEDLKVLIHKRFERLFHEENIDAACLVVRNSSGKPLAGNIKVKSISSTSCTSPLLVGIKRPMGSRGRDMIHQHSSTVSKSSQNTAATSIEEESDQDLAARMAIKCEAYDSLAVVSTLVFGSAIFIWREDLGGDDLEGKSALASRAILVLGALSTASSMIATVNIVGDSYSARQLLSLKQEPGKAAQQFLLGSNATKQWRRIGIHSTFLSIILIGAQATARLARIAVLFEDDQEWRNAGIGSAIVLGMAILFCILDWTWDVMSWRRIV